MTVYVVMRHRVETRPTECSYDEDGYYDDYYDEEFPSDEIICICATKQLAEDIVDREDRKSGWSDYVFYQEYEVLEDEEERVKPFDIPLPTKEQIAKAEERLESAKKVFKD